jgi:hypothetical protein
MTYTSSKGVVSILRRNLSHGQRRLSRPKMMLKSSLRWKKELQWFPRMRAKDHKVGQENTPCPLLRIS